MKKIWSFKVEDDILLQTWKLNGTQPMSLEKTSLSPCVLQSSQKPLGRNSALLSITDMYTFVPSEVTTALRGACILEVSSYSKVIFSKQLHFSQDKSQWHSLSCTALLNNYSFCFKALCRECSMRGVHYSSVQYNWLMLCIYWMLKNNETKSQPTQRHPPDACDSSLWAHNPWMISAWAGFCRRTTNLERMAVLCDDTDSLVPDTHILYDTWILCCVHCWTDFMFQGQGSYLPCPTLGSWDTSKMLKTLIGGFAFFLSHKFVVPDSHKLISGCQNISICWKAYFSKVDGKWKVFFFFLLYIHCLPLLLIFSVHLSHMILMQKAVL